MGPEATQAKLQFAADLAFRLYLKSTNPALKVVLKHRFCELCLLLGEPTIPDHETRPQTRPRKPDANA